MHCSASDRMVVLVLDPEFGSKLSQLDRTTDTWLFESASNDEAVRSYYRSAAPDASTTGYEPRDHLARLRDLANAKWMVSTIHATEQSRDEECRRRRVVCVARSVRANPHARSRKSLGDTKMVARPVRRRRWRCTRQPRHAGASRWWLHGHHR